MYTQKGFKYTHTCATYKNIHSRINTKHTQTHSDTIVPRACWHTHYIYIYLRRTLAVRSETRHQKKATEYSDQQKRKHSCKKWLKVKYFCKLKRPPNSRRKLTTLFLYQRWRKLDWLYSWAWFPCWAMHVLLLPRSVVAQRSPLSGRWKVMPWVHGPFSTTRKVTFGPTSPILFMAKENFGVVFMNQLFRDHVSLSKSLPIMNPLSAIYFTLRRHQLGKWLPRRQPHTICTRGRTNVQTRLVANARWMFHLSGMFTRAPLYNTWISALKRLVHPLDKISMAFRRVRTQFPLKRRWADVSLLIMWQPNHWHILFSPLAIP